MTDTNEKPRAVRHDILYWAFKNKVDFTSDILPEPLEGWFWGRDDLHDENILIPKHKAAIGGSVDAMDVTFYILDLCEEYDHGG